MLRLILLVFAFVIFLLATFNVIPNPTLNLTDLGLAFFAASFLFAGVGPEFSWPTRVA